MARKGKSFWSQPKKLLTLVSIVAASVATLALANYGMKQYFALKSQAAIGSASFFYEPSILTLNSSSTTNLNAWATVNQGVETLELTYMFDPLVVLLTGDITFPDSQFLYHVSHTPFKDANSTGRGSMTISMNPIFSASPSGGVKGTATYAPASPRTTTSPVRATVSPSTPAPSAYPSSTCKPRPACLDSEPKCTIADRPDMYCPTPIASTASPVALPVGTFKLATFPLRAQKPSVSQSIFNFDLKTSTIRGGDQIQFEMTSEPANLYLNSPVNPSQKPTPTPTPTPPSTPRACRKEDGTCWTKTKTCLTYSDSCAKADFCATPFTICQTPPSPSPNITPTPTPFPVTPQPSIRPGCYMATPRLCTKTLVGKVCDPILTCPTTRPTSTPRSTNTPSSSACYKIFGASICLPPPIR